MYVLWAGYLKHGGKSNIMIRPHTIKKRDYDKF